MAMTFLNLRASRQDEAPDGQLVFVDLREARAEQMKRNAAEAAKGEIVVAETKQAINPLLFSLGGDAEDAKFRRITSPATRRDLNPLMQERMQQICFFLATTTPFGKRIVEIITSYVVGEGFKAVAEDEAVQEVIDRFVSDPVNDFDANLKAFSDELVKFGELCIPVAVNPVDGFVRIGYVDPQDIDAVEYGLLTTGDGGQEISIPVAVRLRARIGEREGRRLVIVHRDEDINSATFGQLTGDCFYQPINKAKSASRGISDLFSLADWIDVLDQMIFDFADKVRFLNAFIWDYTLKGADDKTVTDFTKKVTKSPPKQGGVQVHNEQVEIKATTPDFKGADMKEGVSMVKTYGMGGLGIPPMFFGDPMDSNRSTAEAMEGPTGKKLTDRQNDIKRLIIRMLNFVIEQAQAHGVIEESADLTFKLQVPELLIKDLQKAATTMQGVSGALAVAEDRGWVRGETAARGMHVVLTQIGIEVDSANEYKLAQEQLTAKRATEQDALNPQKNLADALKNLPGGAAALPAAGGTA